MKTLSKRARQPEAAAERHETLDILEIGTVTWFPLSRPYLYVKSCFRVLFLALFSCWMKNQLSFLPHEHQTFSRQSRHSNIGHESESFSGLYVVQSSIYRRVSSPVAGSSGTFLASCRLRGFCPAPCPHLQTNSPAGRGTP